MQKIFIKFEEYCIKIFNVIGNCVRSFFGFKKIYYSIPHLGFNNHYIVLTTDDCKDPYDILIAISDKVKKETGIFVSSDQIEIL